MKIMVLNGPNINLLGTREPEVYGVMDYETLCQRVAGEAAGHELHFFQSNVEGELVNFLHAALKEGYGGVVMNPGAYTHYSYALRDAVAAIRVPVVEVHLSNIHGREDFRKTSVTATACRGLIAGLGWYGYALAVQALTDGKA